MKDMGDTYFDEAVDGYIPIPPGVYPGHVKELEVKSESKLGPFKNNSKVFNVTFVIADEVKDYDILKMTKDNEPALDENNNDVFIKGDFLVGKNFKSVGLWVTPAPGKGEGWKNRRYIEFMETLGVKFPKVDNKKKVMEIEESDIIGKPCLIKLDSEEYEKDGEVKSVMKAFDVFTWPDGDELDAAELDADVPF